VAIPIADFFSAFPTRVLNSTARMYCTNPWRSRATSDRPRDTKSAK